jgi:hypothetical protein
MQLDDILRVSRNICKIVQTSHSVDMAVRNANGSTLSVPTIKLNQFRVRQLAFMVRSAVYL